MVSPPKSTISARDFFEDLPDKKDQKNRISCKITRAILDSKLEGTDLCLVCKGSRLLCGRAYCPLIQRISAVTQPDSEKKLSAEMFGPSPPSIFVGHKGYPNVFVGPMSCIDPDKPALADDPSKWYGLDFDSIISLRSNLVRSKSIENIKSDSRLVLDSRELALSVKPTDVELTFSKAPKFNMSFSSMTQPMGPTGTLKDFSLAQNTKIPRIVDYVVSDDITATEGASRLFERGHDVYYLSKILSSGAMGQMQNKKMVPTRWSITAVDDMISKDLLKDIRDYPPINDYRVYENTYLDNHFEVLMMPGSWEFENFEAWAPNTLWTLSQDKPIIQVESEPYHGRTTYAKSEGGGYYAVRLPVTEKLHAMRRQARVVSFREVYEGYVMPVGVWEVRENVRAAVKKKPSRFSTLSEALSHISSKLRIDISDYVSRSKVLRQRRLSDF